MELPWWTYGARGMQLWFPSALEEPLTPGYQPASQADPELEFDHEVYPVGVSLSEVSVIGAPCLHQPHTDDAILGEMPRADAARSCIAHVCTGSRQIPLCAQVSHSVCSALREALPAMHTSACPPSTPSQRASLCCPACCAACCSRAGQLLLAAWPTVIPR